MNGYPNATSQRSVKVEEMPCSLNFLKEFTSGLISFWRLTQTFNNATYYWALWIKKKKANYSL